MTADREAWFRELEPPAGGAERLRLRLEEAGRPAAVATARRVFIRAAAATMAVAVALFSVLRNDDGTHTQDLADLYEAAPFDRLLGRPMAHTEPVVTVDAQAVRVSRIDGSKPKIRIYRVD